MMTNIWILFYILSETGNRLLYLLPIFGWCSTYIELYAWTIPKYLVNMLEKIKILTVSKVKLSNPSLYYFLNLCILLKIEQFNILKTIIQVALLFCLKLFELTDYFVIMLIKTELNCQISVYNLIFIIRLCLCNMWRWCKSSQHTRLRKP